MKAGDTFGLWTVIFIGDKLVTETEHPRKAALCQCQCGKVQLIRKSDVLNGRSTGCRSCVNSSRTTFESAMTEIFNNYKRSALDRNVLFSLSIEDFLLLVKSDCFYCGSEPRTRAPRARDFFYNGIDRKDNAMGYQLENCVPCCGVCNRGKNNMPYEEWIEYLDRLAKHRSN